MIFDSIEKYDGHEPAGVELPKIALTERELGGISEELDENSSTFEILKALARNGVKDRGILNKEDKDVYLSRAKYELDTLEELGFSDYILLNWDVINFCHSNAIPTGAGRGCFIPTSLVTLADGSKKEIKDVSIGDSVLDHENNSQKVIDVLEYEVDEDLIELDFGRGKIIKCTLDHKFYTENRGWVEAQNLTENDDVRGIYAAPLPEPVSMKLKKRKIFKYKGIVNDLTIENTHSYNVENLAVHNSAAGSLVLYLLGVTNIDPVPDDLFFERFVSKTRAKKVKDSVGKEFLVGSLLPDVDTDISYEHRKRVIEYIEKKHFGRTAKILTFNTFSSKLCIKEATKYFDEVREEEAGAVSDMIPKNHGKVAGLSAANEESDKFKAWARDHNNAFKNALKIEGFIKNSGVHPSGIAICSQDISSIAPLQKTKEGELITAYSMNDVADLMVKFDILGLRTLTIAHKACEKIGINIEDIDPNDSFIYETLQDFNHPVGLFQISAETNFRVCQEVKPVNINELSDVIALARPSSLQFVDEYINQKNNPTALNMHKDLDDILSWSNNVILYQEQLMKIANKVFGFSLEEAETLRRIIGKKKTSEMPVWEQRIKDAAENLGIGSHVSDFYWSALKASADYGFNKCLSPDSVVESEDGFKCMFEVDIGDKILAYNKELGKDEYVEVIDKMESVRDLYEVEFDDGRIIKCSMSHKFMCEDGKMRSLEKILKEGREIMCKHSQTARIKRVKYIGKKDTLDFEVNSKDHNFYCEGLVTSNSHSFSYANLAAKTVYLKYKHPKEFFLSVLESAGSEPEPLLVVNHVNEELSDFGMELLPPCLFKSQIDFSIEDGGIRYGLNSIKGVSEKALEGLIEFRGMSFNNKYEVFLAAKEQKINISVLSALIQAGTMSEGEKSTRSRTVLEAQSFNLLTDREKRNFCKIGEKFDYDILNSISKAVGDEMLGDDGRLIMPQRRFETFKKKFERFRDIYNENRKHEQFTHWWYENSLLGYSYSCLLKDCFEAEYGGLDTLKSVVGLPEGVSFRSVCQVKDFNTRISSNRNKYLLLEVSDNTASSRFMLMDQRDDPKLERFLSCNKLKKGDIIVASGRTGDGGMSFLDKVTIVETKVFMKLRDLK